MNNFDVILVSSFGQLDALSVELGRLGLNTLLIDVTEKLGTWPLEDREGPFAEFHIEKPMGAWGEALFEGDLGVPCPDGFVIWTQQGPVSLRGPLATHQMAARNWNTPETELNSQVPFEKLVLPWLSYSLHSTRFLEWSYHPIQKSRVPLAAPMNIRFPTRAGLEKRREWIKSQGVAYWGEVEILDGAVQGLDSVVGLEVKGPVNGVIKARSVVWGLTSLETDHISYRVREKIFGSDVRRPDWAWLRYRFQINPREETTNWPLYMVVVESLGAPWTHEDFFILHRTVLDDQFDVWIRIPDSKRFHQNYLLYMKEKIMGRLQKRLPSLEIRLVHEPQEMTYTSKELGPRPFVQYPQSMKLRDYRRKTLFLDGPEVWEQYSSSHMVNNQKRIFDQILVEWRKAKSEDQK